MSFKSKVPLAILRPFSEQKWLFHSNGCTEMGKLLFLPISLVFLFSSAVKTLPSLRKWMISGQLVTTTLWGHALNVVHPFKYCNYSFPPPLSLISTRPQMWKCFWIEVINLRGQSDSSNLSCGLSFSFCAACSRGSTRPQSCHSWIQVREPLCHWSGPRSVEVTAAAPCSPWAGWAGLQGSGPTADRSGSPAAAPGSWCSAWPGAGSRSCSASSPEGGWGWACGALRRRHSRCAGASVP